MSRSDLVAVLGTLYSGAPESDRAAVFRGLLRAAEMALKEKILLTVQLVFTLCVVSTFPKAGVTFELEDTIHTLREENAYLQERLESLTEALRELRKLLWNRSKGEFDSDDPHEWDDWTEFGKSTDAYRLLEQAFCGTDLRSASGYGLRSPDLLPVSSVYLVHLLLRCLQ
ncbi:uncharacterized protein LOC106585304 [Arapaima gigas]